MMSDAPNRLVAIDVEPGGTPQMREQGKTALQCRAFGRWKHLKELGYTPA